MDTYLWGWPHMPAVRRGTRRGETKRPKGANYMVLAPSSPARRKRKGDLPWGGSTRTRLNIGGAGGEGKTVEQRWGVSLRAFLCARYPTRIFGRGPMRRNIMVGVGDGPGWLVRKGRGGSVLSVLASSWQRQRYSSSDDSQGRSQQRSRSQQRWPR